MAKSARSSRIKDNRSKLRKTVHAPHEEARYARLSEKLLETARSSVTAAGTKDKEAKDGEAKDGEAMEVEKTEEAATGEEAAKPVAIQKRISRTRVQRRTKARNTMVFKSLQKGVRVTAAKKKKPAAKAE